MGISPTHGTVLAAAMLFAVYDSLAADNVIKTAKHDIRIEVVARGLEHPWGLAFLPDGRALVTERPGRLRQITREGKLDARPIEGIPEIVEHGQGGLLDVALHPRFSENGLVYLSYAGRGPGGYSTEVLRGRLNGHRLEQVQVIFRQLPKSSAGRHFGSRLVFDRSGYLYVTMGDRGDMERAQRLDDLAGKVVRLHDDGRVPADNPFVGRTGARPEVYTLGNRNVQGAALHPETGELWAHEHGPQGGDELNILRAGNNYGWPVITYGVQYIIGTRIGEGTAKAGMEQPVKFWVPSIAPSGMSFVKGSRFPGWKGNLFVGALKDQMLVRLELDGNRVTGEERMLKGALGRIRDIREGPDGLLYVLTDDADGRLIRIAPAQ